MSKNDYNLEVFLKFYNQARELKGEVSEALGLAKGRIEDKEEKIEKAKEEEGLENFAGCAVVISHDRWFLDRICTHILAFEGDSQVYFFEGGYSDYEENKKKRLGDKGPTRIRYKKLVK